MHSGTMKCKKELNVMVSIFFITLLLFLKFLPVVSHIRLHNYVLELKHQLQIFVIHFLHHKLY